MPLLHDAQGVETYLNLTEQHNEEFLPFGTVYQHAEQLSEKK